MALLLAGADTGGCIGAYAPPGHSRECWCTPCGYGIKSEPIEIRNSFQYNLIKIDISNIFYKYFRTHKDPGSHFCAEDNFSASARGAKKNHRGCKKKITGGAWILQGVHEKKISARFARRESCTPWPNVCIRPWISWTIKRPTSHPHTV